MMGLPEDYVEAGFVITPIPSGTKGPSTKGWNLRENCITSVEQINGHEVGYGLCHAYSGTMSLDVDQAEAACDWLKEQGVDLVALFNDGNNVRLESGRPGRGKLIFRLPEGVDPLPSKKVKDGNKCDVIDFRCGTRDGLTVQDVLPPSIHPDTGQPYTWKGDWHDIPVIPESLLAIWQTLISPPKEKPDIKSVPDDLEAKEIWRLLGFLDPDMGREDWLEIGMALHSSQEPWGFNMWNAWSAQGEKYRDGDCATRWKSFSLDREDPVTMLTLFKLASDAGANIRTAEEMFPMEQPTLTPGEQLGQYEPTIPSAGTGDPNEVMDLIPHRASDWQGRPIPEISWVWDTWLPHGTVAGIGGPPGAAKSLLAQILASHVAAGQPYLGNHIIRSAALYITCEDSLDELHRRQDRINHAMMVDYSDQTYLHYDSWLGEDANLVTISKNGLFSRTVRFRLLDQLIGDLGVKFVALDLLADMWNGNENDRQQVNTYIKGHLAYLAQRHNATLVGIYHPSRSGIQSGTGESGSTAWEGSFRSRIYISAENEDMPNERTIKRMKANYAGLTEEEVTWKHGYLTPKSMFGGEMDTDKVEATRVIKAAFLQCLEYCETKGIHVSPSVRGEHYYGREFVQHWNMLRKDSPKLGRTKFEGVFHSLLHDGQIKLSEREKNNRQRLMLGKS